MGKIPIMRIVDGERYQELLQYLLRPVVRFCRRNGLYIQDLLEAAKIVFVQETRRELAEAEEKENLSRISAATGLQRKDVQRLLNQSFKESQSLLSRVLGQWQLDKRFVSASKQPKLLKYGGERCEFSVLVHSVSTDLNPGTVLFELERLGLVDKTGDKIKLVSRSYVPLKNAVDSFELLASDVECLSRAVEENVRVLHRIPNLHGTTEFNNIALSSIPKVREWLVKEGSDFHARIRKFLSQHDLDFRRNLGEGGARVSVGTFSLVVNPSSVQRSRVLEKSRIRK